MNDEFDLLIGVTALENKLTLVTDNEKDFSTLMELKLKIGSQENNSFFQTLINKPPEI
jgi:tRNA(fMet)-specific endonuclease VapC